MLCEITSVIIPAGCVERHEFCAAALFDTTPDPGPQTKRGYEPTLAAPRALFDSTPVQA